MNEELDDLLNDLIFTTEQIVESEEHAKLHRMYANGEGLDKCKENLANLRALTESIRNQIKELCHD